MLAERIERLGAKIMLPEEGTIWPDTKYWAAMEIGSFLAYRNAVIAVGLPMQGIYIEVTAKERYAAFQWACEEGVVFW